MDPAYVSTGDLPTPEHVQALVSEAHERYTRQCSLRVSARDLAIIGATDVGQPAKRGIVTVSPGKGGMGTFAPRLDGAGNSVRGRLAARFLSERLGMDLLISAPAR